MVADLDQHMAGVASAEFVHVLHELRPELIHLVACLKQCLMLFGCHIPSCEPVVIPTTVHVESEFRMAALPLPSQRRPIGRLRTRPSGGRIATDVPAHHMEGSATIQMDRVPNAVRVLVMLAVESRTACIQPPLHPVPIGANAALDVKAEPDVPLCGQCLECRRIIQARAEADRCRAQRARHIETALVPRRGKIERARRLVGGDVAAPDSHARSPSLADGGGRRPAETGIKADDHGSRRVMKMLPATMLSAANSSVMLVIAALVVVHSPPSHSVEVAF